MAALTSAAHTAPTIPDCEPQPPLVMYWSENDILCLVQDYRKHPCLWNPQFPTYNNKMIREIEWQCIKRSLVYKCKKTFSILQIKRKIRRLLLIYKRYRRPHCLSRFQPWYAFHYMNDFLEHREIREDEEFMEYQQPIILAVQKIEVVNLDPDPTPCAVENESPVQGPCVTSQVNSSNVVTNVSDNQQCQLQQQPEQQQQQLFQQQWQQLKQQHQQQWQQLQQQQQLQQFRQQWQQWKQLQLQLQLQERQEQVSQEHHEQEPQQEHEEEPQQQQERKQLQKPQQKKQQKKPKLQRQQQERKQLQKPQQKKQQKKPKLQRQQQERKQLQKPQQKKQQKKPKLQRQQQERKQLQKPQQKKQQKKPKLQRQQRWLRSSSQEQQRWLRSSTQHRQEQQQQQQRLLRSSPQQRKKQQRQQQRLLRSSPQPQKQYSENSDDCGLFGKFVALKMRKMSQERREAITIQINKCFYNEMKNSKTSHK